MFNILDKHALEHSDLATLFTTLIECYCYANNSKKATQIVNNAYKYLKDTNYEGEIQLAEAKIAVYKNDSKSALKILNEIRSNQDVFIKVNFTCF